MSPLRSPVCAVWSPNWSPAPITDQTHRRLLYCDQDRDLDSWESEQREAEHEAEQTTMTKTLRVTLNINKNIKLYIKYEQKYQTLYKILTKTSHVVFKSRLKTHFHSSLIYMFCFYNVLVFLYFFFYALIT